MQRRIAYKIDEKYDGKSIERFLRDLGYTRQSLVDLKKMNENLLIDGKWVYLNHALTAGDELVVQIDEKGFSEKIVPVDLAFKVTYEDEDILVIDKPYDMPIHPSINNYDNTLANAVAYYYKEKGIDITFRCINRLDRDTSGLTIIAKHQVASGILYDRMSRREIHREYLAIVEGEDIEDSGIVDLPIGRKPESGIERCIDIKNGEKAVTHYRVENRFYNKALVSLWLETGRTHQIRVHMSHIGHPLIGDWLYNPHNKDMKRQALHSHRLSFVHPITNEQMELVSDIPSDMMEVINAEK